MKSLIDRLKDRCRVDPATGCWVWAQGVNKQGYPQMSMRAICSSAINVRRLVYVMEVGQIPVHSVVLSTCGDRSCINPAHLRIVTRKAMATKTIREVNKRLTPESRRKAKLGHSETWHPQAPPPSRINGSVPGGNSKRPPQPVSPVTSAYVAGLLTAAAIGSARKSPTGSDESCGPTSGQGLGE